MTPTLLYKGFRLAPTTTQDGDDMYQARVAIVTLNGDRPRSQRFVDFELYRDRSEADARAIAGGMEWVDAHLNVTRLSYPMRFATLG
jgi:hypothetical protein